MTFWLKARRSREVDEVEVRALAGNDWGAEAQPKVTEFETEAAAKAMTSADFDKMV